MTQTNQNPTAACARRSAAFAFTLAALALGTGIRVGNIISTTKDDHTAVTTDGGERINPARERAPWVFGGYGLAAAVLFTAIGFGDLRAARKASENTRQPS